MLFAKGEDCDEYCMLTCGNLSVIFYAIPSIARVWNIATFPRLPTLHFFSISILSFINEMLSCEIWKNRRKSHFIPLTIVTGRCLGFPDLSCLKLFLCSPSTHPSQDWRGAVRYSKDSFSFLILHGSPWFPVAVSLNTSDITPDIQSTTFLTILQAPNSLC